MTIRFSFDTNILVYAADREAGDRHDIAKALMDRAGVAGRGALTEQSLLEFTHIVTRRSRLPFSAAAGFVESWLAFFELLVPDREIVREAISLASRYQLGVWDARMLSICQANRCLILLTEDMQDRACYGDVRVVNPFRKSNDAIIEELFVS
jgi:predicted nucleic acid-binding protein